MDMKEQIGWKRPGQFDPIKVKEQYGTGVLNGAGIANTMSIRHTFTFDKYDGTLNIGQRGVIIPDNSLQEASHIIVYRNGVALKAFHEYDVDIANNEIIFADDIQSTDRDVEVRIERFQGVKAENVLLLPISEHIPYEELGNYAPSYGDVFVVDKLMKNNPLLHQYTQHHGRVVTWEITENGIVGTLQLFKGESTNV